MIDSVEPDRGVGATNGALVPTDEGASDSRAAGVTGRIARGAAANIGGIGVTLIIQLVSVPVLLTAWGVPTYGEWLILSAFPVYIALSDLSFSAVAGNSMVMLVAQGKRADAATLGRRLSSIVSVMTGIVILAAVAIAVLFGGALGAGAAIPVAEAQAVLVALFLQVAVVNQHGVLDAWYRAGGRYPLGSTLRQFSRMLEFGALVGSVLLGAGPAAAAMAFLGGSLVGFVASAIVLRRAVPWSTLRPERPHLQTVRELLAPGVAFMAFPIGNALSLQGITIVIGATLGATAVVVFSTTRTATRVVLQAMGALGNSVWPELTRSVGGGHLAEARMILSRATRLSVGASFTLVLILAVAGPAVISWWTRGAVSPPSGLLYVLLLVVVCNTFWYTRFMVLLATNQHAQVAVFYLLGTASSLMAAVPLTAAFGLIGAAISLLAIDIVMAGVVLPRSLRIVGDTPGAFLHVFVDVSNGLRRALANVRSAT